MLGVEPYNGQVGVNTRLFQNTAWKGLCSTIVWGASRPYPQRYHRLTGHPERWTEVGLPLSVCVLTLLEQGELEGLE